jgi:hypothetical protein
MAIVDGRTLLSGFETGDTPAQPDDLTGGAGGTADTEIYIQGARSWGYYSGSTRDGLLYDAGSAQDWSNNTFYIWLNCGVAGLLNTKAAGGVRARFCGETVTDYFEVNLAGSDDYPDAVQGGWVCFVVDIEKAKTATDGQGGAPPATNAIRYVGVSTQTPTMPRMADNTWLDAIWRLPQNTAGIRVEGQNTGSVDWTWADIAAESATNAWGTAKVTAGGAIAINTPIQFGANDAVTHGFSDTNQVILWEDWDVATSFYGLTVIGGSGTQSFSAGTKTGTGEDATGAQGWTIAAAAAGQRWFFDADDANVDVCNLYGCSFIHGGDFQLDDAQIEVISTLFIDCTSAAISNIGAFIRNSVIDPNTANATAFATVDIMDRIDYCSFEFTDGYAVEITANTSPQASKGNSFSGFGANDTDDSGVHYTPATGDMTLNVTDGGNAPTVDDRSAGTVTVSVNPVTALVKCLNANTQSAVQSAYVYLEVTSNAGGFPYLDSISVSVTATTATVTHTGHGLTTNDKVRIRGLDQNGYNGIKTITVTGANTYTYTVVNDGAATGASQTSTFIVLAGTTDVNGEISNSYSFAANQPVTGKARLNSGAGPYYVTANITDTINSSTGLSYTATLVPDGA